MSYDAPDGSARTHIARRIKMRRLQLGMSQEELADKLGVTYQQVQKYENGKTALTVDRLIQIAGAMGVNPAYFVRDIGDDRAKGDHETREGLNDYSMAALTPTERKVVDRLRAMNSSTLRAAVLTILRSLTGVSES